MVTQSKVNQDGGASRQGLQHGSRGGGGGQAASAGKLAGFGMIGGGMWGL